MSIKDIIKTTPLFNAIIYSPFVALIPDKIFLSLYYRISRGEALHLKNPKKFNEKIQWLKLYNRDTPPHGSKKIRQYANKLCTLVDKYEVRKYVADTIGNEYLIPLVGGPWNSVSEIDTSALPVNYVLKCTHDSGSVFIKKADTTPTELNKMFKKLSLSCKKNYYYFLREWAYKDVKPRLIAERYMCDESETELKDYKIHVFNGVPKMIQVDFGRFSGSHRRNFYTTDWELLNLKVLYPRAPEVSIAKPEKLHKMLEIAHILAGGLPYARIDLYSIHQSIYFGEITLYHGSGLEPISPEQWNYTLGDWIDLSGVGNV